MKGITNNMIKKIKQYLLVAVMGLTLLVLRLFRLVSIVARLRTGSLKARMPLQIKAQVLQATAVQLMAWMRIL